MEHIEQEIGEAAGKIWKVLEEKGPMSKAKIAKQTKLPANLVNQGLGWLAREGKLTQQKQKNTEVIGLKE